VVSAGPVGAGMPSVEELRAQALGVARAWSPPGAPESWRLTAALFDAIAAQDDLLDRLAGLPADRLPALLGSAAVAYLVRRDRPAGLAGYFPVPGSAQPRFDDEFFPSFRAFCSARLDDLAEVCRGRRYQMNEVARCAQIALGIVAATAGSDGPVALVDVGTGAGLGLQLDRYRYQVGTVASDSRNDRSARSRPPRSAHHFVANRSRILTTLPNPMSAAAAARSCAAAGSAISESSGSGTVRIAASASKAAPP